MSAPLFYFNNTAADVWGVLFCILAVIILITAAQVEKKIRGYLLGVFVCLLTDLLVNMLGLLLRGETSGIKMTVLHVSNYMEFFCGYVLAALLVQLLVYGVYVLLLSCTLAAVHALHTPPRSDPGFCLGEA